MSAEPDQQTYDEDRFLSDLEQGANTLGAPYDRHVMKHVVTAYRHLLSTSAIQIRTSNVAASPIHFRLFMDTPADTMQIAENEGWLQHDNPMLALAKSSRLHCDGAIEQPEFSTDKGCDALLMYLNGLWDLDYILDIPGMPECIKANRQPFLNLDLNKIIVEHFDYTQGLLSFYFLITWPLTKNYLDKLAGLASAPPPSKAEYDEIMGVLLDRGYYFTAVMDYYTGKIVKVELQLFLPVKLPPELVIPDVGERLTSFWDLPAHEHEEFDILSYCFGDVETGSIMAHRAYCGGFRELLRSWNILGA